MKNHKIDVKIFANLNLILFFALTVLANIFIGYLIGYGLSSLTNNDIWKIVFLFLGIISGLYNGIMELLKEAEKQDNELRTKKEGKRDNNKNNNSFDD
ncbi:AtpZ/AtpI family protein [Marinitoga aeolica]|uniref:AtpZ/AtpI family protein n=1 Tax=Marinitoga aeolica TaxID=2809031 RepID=A0ABY8PNJ7_9BACT|nr:AtpZ/AtpI family protein [Marinitoga aeolica]WGS64103.1 AtpZ/AtpI family protein [Marinitoga aeolica]